MANSKSDDLDDAVSRKTAFLFDLDGTLVDSVYQHVLAWREALEAGGIRLAVWRIHRQIGMIAAAWLAQAENKSDVAIAMMRSAADLDDATDKHPVTPGSVLPAREQLGELLLELKQPREALREFEASFRNTPNRFNGLYGAARAARLGDDEKTARTYYAKLIELCAHADTIRPELEEAKAYVARK